MIKVLYKLKSSALVLILVACNNGPSSSSKKNGPSRKPEREPEQPVSVKCKTSDIQKILDDGRTVVSKLKGSDNALILWDAFTHKLKRKIDYAFNFLDMSSTGEYVLQGISKKSFQVLSIFNDQITYSEKLRFSYGTKPKLLFTPVGNYIFTQIKLFRNKFKVSMFDIENRDVIFSKNIEGFKAVDAYSNEKFSYIKGKGSWGNILTTFNFRNGTSDTFSIKSGKVQSLTVTSEFFLVKVNNRYFIYNNDSGEFVRSLKVDNLYSVDKKSNMVLVSDDNIVQIIDLESGKITKFPEITNRIVLSSCVLSFNRGDVLCKSLNAPEELVKINLFSDGIEKICY